MTSSSSSSSSSSDSSSSVCTPQDLLYGCHASLVQAIGSMATLLLSGSQESKECVSVVGGRERGEREGGEKRSLGREEYGTKRTESKPRRMRKKEIRENENMSSRRGKGIEVGAGGRRRRGQKKKVGNNRRDSVEIRAAAQVRSSNKTSQHSVWSTRVAKNR